MPPKKRYGYWKYYRLLNRPNEDVEALDVVPIMPPKIRMQHKVKHDYHREIAWSIDYRGDNDDVPTLLYVGAGYTIVKKVFMQMFGVDSVLFNGFRLYRDYYHYQRQQRAWVRIAVELRNYNSHIMSVFDLGKVMELQFPKLCICNIKYIKLDKFLNV